MLYNCQYKELPLDEQILRSNQYTAYYTDQIYNQCTHGVYLGFECNNGIITTLAFEIERRE